MINYLENQRNHASFRSFCVFGPLAKAKFAKHCITTLFLFLKNFVDNC